MTSSSLKNARASVAKVSTVIVVSHVLQNELFRNPIFTNKWLYAAVSQLIGWVVYDVFVDGKQNFKHSNPRIAAAMNTTFKMGVIFVVSKIVSTGMDGKVDLNEKWIISTIKVLAGFALVELGSDLLPKWKGHQGTIKDLAFVAVTSALPILIDGGKLDEKFWMKTATVGAGFFVFDEYLKGTLF
jgi:hypothetical protein